MKIQYMKWMGIKVYFVEAYQKRINEPKTTNTYRFLYRTLNFNERIYMKEKIKSNKYQEIVLKTYAYHPLS